MSQLSALERELGKRVAVHTRTRDEIAGALAVRTAELGELNARVNSLTVREEDYIQARETGRHTPVKDLTQVQNSLAEAREQLSATEHTVTVLRGRLTEVEGDLEECDGEHKKLERARLLAAAKRAVEENTHRAHEHLEHVLDCARAIGEARRQLADLEGPRPNPLILGPWVSEEIGLAVRGAGASIPEAAKRLWA